MIVLQDRYLEGTNELKEGSILVNAPGTGADLIELALLPHLRPSDFIASGIPGYESEVIVGQHDSGIRHHMTCSELKKKNKRLFNHYRKIIVVRNPIDVALDLYTRERKRLEGPLVKNLRKEVKTWYDALDKKGHKEIDTFREEARMEIKDTKSVRIKSFFDIASILPPHWNSFEAQYLNQEGEKQDIIIKFEDLEEGVQKLFNEYQFPKPQLSWGEYASYNRISYLADEIYHHSLLQPYVFGNLYFSPEKIIRDIYGTIHGASNRIYSSKPALTSLFGYEKLSADEKFEAIRTYVGTYVEEGFRDVMYKAIDHHYEIGIETGDR